MALCITLDAPLVLNHNAPAVYVCWKNAELGEGVSRQTMIFEAQISGLATDLFSRTSSTVRVQAILQLSLAPVFLLAAIGAVLNVMNSRLIWIVERVHKLELRIDSRETRGREAGELPALLRRQQYAHLAINLSTTAAILICAVVALLFVSAFVRPSLGTAVALLWIASMVAVFSALICFLLETRIATSSMRERQRIAKQTATQADQSSL